MRRRNFDNISIAHTKSSLAMKNKINANPELETRRFEPPYFRENQLRIEIQQRGKQCLGSAEQPKQTSHLDKAGSIVANLMKRHQEVKQKLEGLKQQNKRRVEDECPFQPKKVNNIEKVVVVDSFLRRNDAWMQEREKKNMARRQDQLVQDLNRCTFSPQIHKSKSLSRHASLTPQPRKCANKYANTPPPGKRNKDISKEQFEASKRNIMTRLLSKPR